MLSYRHSYHAGNHADVLKHIVLIEILKHLIKKEGAFDYIDTHAGAGMYNLKSDHSNKLQEHAHGIAKLTEKHWPELAIYFEILKTCNPQKTLQFYPGSPMIARHFLRSQDKAWLYELHSTDAELLAKNMAHVKRVRVMREDGFKGLLSLLPPVSRRAVVLIDPSYEIKTDYKHVFETLFYAYKKFPTAVYALWYPVIDRKLIDALERKFIKSGIKNIQSFELAIAEDQIGSGMSASGIIVINPPWTLMDAMSDILPKLVTTLGGEGAFYKCNTLTIE